MKISLLMLFLNLLSFLFVDTTTPVLLSSEFSGPTFSDPSGWSIAFGNIGYTSVDSKSIFGGLNQFGVNTQIQKVFTLPPHYLIRIQITIWTFGKWNNGEIKLLCDERVMSSKKLYTMQNDYHRSPTMSNVILYHNAATAIISIRPSIQDQYTQSWGIRDFQIYYYPCPNGCQICSDTHKQSSDCNSWILSYSQFTTNSIDKIHNEGWFINDDKINFTFEKCNGLTLFGYYNAGQTLKRTFYLDAHDRIRIKFLLIKVNDWDKSVLQLLIDGVSQYQYSDKTDQLHNINYCDSNTGLDSIERIDLEFDHSNQLTEFLFQSTLSQQQLQNKFGIRDFMMLIKCQKCTNEGSIIFNLPLVYLSEQTLTLSPYWKAQESSGTFRLFNCSGPTTILGPFGGYEQIRRVFKLPPHRTMTVSLLLYILWSWDPPGDYMQVYVDQQGVQESKGNSEGGNFCYLGNGAVIRNLTFQFNSHTSDTVTILMISHLDEQVYNEGWGFKNFSITLGDCPFFCPSCNSIPNDQCQYKYWAEVLSLQGITFEDGRGWETQNTFVDTTLQSVVCTNGLSIIGGQAQDRLKYEQSINNHQKIRIILNLYIIGEWQDNEIKIDVNGLLIYSKKITNLNTYLFCTAKNLKTYIINIDQVLNHTSSNVIIQIENDVPSLPRSDISYGVRDFYLYYESL